MIDELSNDFKGFSLYEKSITPELIAWQNAELAPALSFLTSIEAFKTGRHYYYYEPDGGFYEHSSTIELPKDACTDIGEGLSKIHAKAKIALEGANNLLATASPEQVEFLLENTAKIKAVLAGSQLGIDCLFATYKAEPRQIEILMPCAHHIYRVYDLSCDLLEKIADRLSNTALGEKTKSEALLALPLAVHYVKENRDLITTKSYRVFKPDETKVALPVAVTAQGGIYVHCRIPLDKGEDPCFKKVKSAFSVTLDKPVAKLTSIAGYATSEAHIAANEQKFLELAKDKNIPHVAKLYDVVWFDKFTKKYELVRRQVIYLELGVNGSLYKSKTRLAGDPVKVRKILRGILEGVAGLHAEKIVHGDLKDANIVLDADDNPIIIDFGFAQLEGKVVYDFRCSPLYTDPQAFYRYYVKKCHQDIWSVGIIWYCNLFNVRETPWSIGATQDTLAGLTREKREYLFPEPDLAKVYEHLCWQMLQLDPRKRPTAEEGLKFLDAFFDENPT